MPSLPTSSSTGVRIAGDRYQWLAAWHGCVTALRETDADLANPVVSVGVEATGAGNLDDVVLYRATPPHTYIQVKYAVDASTPVGEHYLLAPSTSGGPSILKKAAASWKKLAEAGDPVDLALLSNRFPDPADPLLSARDARTGYLLPKAALQGPGSKLGQARARWAANAGITEDELLTLLGVLRFDLGREPFRLQEHVALLMLAVGLRSDGAAIDQGVDWIARQVRDGQRRLTLESIQHAVVGLGLDSAGPPRAVVSIATLVPDPVAGDADYAIDWVECFEGASAFAKRRPRPPATWAQLQQEIEGAPRSLPVGTSAVAISGSVRLAPAFLTGAAFRMVTGIDVAVLQRGQVWSSTATGPAPATAWTSYEIGQGEELAVAVAVATDLTEDVLEYLRAARIPVDRLLVVQPDGGPADSSIANGAAAGAFAVAIRDRLRRESRNAARIHLFQACPMGLSVLLGHRWNRLRPTIVYEDVHIDDGYEPAFHIDA